MTREYRPDRRENEPLYLLRQAEELLKIGRNNENTSVLIYGCLECRLALEVLDLKLILASVSEDERSEIIEDSKPKNGIERLNKKTGSLKHKYQQFFQSVTEVYEMPGKYYDYRQSKELQHQLSVYIHSYWFTEKEIDYKSKIIQRVFKLVSEVKNFVYKALPRVENSLIITNIEIKSIPEEDKLLLESWKKSEIDDYEKLKAQLKMNLDNREK